MTNETTDIVPQDQGGFLVLADQEAAELLAEAAPSPNDLQKLVVPSGSGGAAFVIETLEGEEFVKELEVVVAYESPVERAFYATDVGDGEPGPPHCSSADGKIGYGVRDVESIRECDGDIEATGLAPEEMKCDDCPFSKFGSALNGGKGQACKQKARLIVFTPDNLLPLVLQVPPTSLKGLKRHKLALLNGRKSIAKTVTKLTLQKHAGSTDYYTVEFGYARDLTEGERTRLAEVASVLTEAAQGE